MHELSIAMSIVGLAEEEAQSRGGLRVSAVHLRLGSLAGVAKDALLFSYGIACEGTPLAGSRLVIEEVPAIAYCPACQLQNIVCQPEWFLCSQCGAPTSEIVQGKELEVVALEVET